ncbi:GlxA family transcriptional regulator [Leeia oryzae]|uniref:GlxA family transcriptional regulator n=1 Tax=Leeia oryzae TaxID=356662 RepID=UPI00037E69D3|nr:GlxA family transcriptional regulator [Leeia oryzae]
MENTASTQKPLNIGFLLSPNFTLGPFGNFIDALRLAADDNDLSRQIRIKWKVMNHNWIPVKASCGVEVSPTSLLVDPSEFDYIVIVGGLIHSGKRIPTELTQYLKRAAQARIPLIGICTGSFILARTGLMEGKRCCVSWFHHKQFVEEFPHLDTHSEEVYIADRDRITCAGGTGVIHMAAYLIERHLSRFEAAKSLRIMLEDSSLSLQSQQLQPQPINTQTTKNLHVKRAMLYIEQQMAEPLTSQQLAEKVNLSTRHLERLFLLETGMTPANFSKHLRLHRAHEMLALSQQSIGTIAQDCGFSDGSHFARAFKSAFGYTPRELRAKQG